jgi:serine/threonine protein kinase
MNRDPHHERVMEVFLGACDLEGEEREEYLAAAANDDPEVRREVEQLLHLDGGGTITPLPARSGAAAADQPQPRHHAAADRYDIGDPIAEGGIAVICRAYDRNLDREVALKRLREPHKDSTEARARLLREASISGALEHPGVPAVHEVGKSEDGEPYIACQLLRGRTLANLLGERDPGVPEELPRLLEIFERVCDTIAYAHSCGIIHRDLKPANVMTDDLGAVHVMDWGLAARDGEAPLRERGSSGLADVNDERGGDSRHTRMGAVLGTPAYMAPEQSIGRGDRRSDVFGLGAILCEILTGEPPFVAESTGDAYVQSIRRDVGGAIKRLQDCKVDEELRNLAAEAISADPEDRPADAGALLARVVAYRKSVAERLRREESAFEFLERDKMATIYLEKFAREFGVPGAGSYWPFKDREDLRLQVIDHWAKEFNEIAATKLELFEGPPRERLEKLAFMILDLGLGSKDTAIRVWAESDPRIASRLGEVYKFRMNLVRNAFEELGFRGDDLEMRTKLYVCYQCGEASIITDASKETFRKLIKLRIELLCRK